MRKRWPALVLFALLPVTYVLYYLDAGKPRTVLWDVMARRKQQDLDGARRRFADRVQLLWSGAWMDATDENLRQWTMWRWDMTLIQERRGLNLVQYLDPSDPFHRYVQTDDDWGQLGFRYVRLAWTGVGWKIDGLWYSSCVVVDGEREFLDRLIRIG